jgi:hypothetical protein
MPGSEEAAAILGIWSLPEFKAAVDQAVARMDPSERVLCAGLAGWAASEDERPAADQPSPYYAVTTSGVHYGLLKKKGGFLSKGVTENRFVARDAIVRLKSDFQSAVDVRSAEDDLLVCLMLRDSLGYQFVRSVGDPASMEPRHQQDSGAAEQLRNIADAIGLPLEG